MKAKRILFILVAIAIIFTLFVKLKAQKEKSATEGIYEWFNGWTSDLVKIRKTYHEKVGLLPIPDTTNYDSIDPKALIELIDLLDFWYNKINLILTGKLTNELILFLKNNLLDGQKIGVDFRQFTVTYFDDYLNLINFMYDVQSYGRKMDNDEVLKYNNLQARYLQSQDNYTKKVNDIYNYNVKRVEEFNNQFKNANVSDLLKLINGN
jgi:hypothetical protein